MTVDRGRRTASRTPVGGQPGLDRLASVVEVEPTACRARLGCLCRGVRLTAVRGCSLLTSVLLSGSERAFLAWIQKCTKKIKAVKKWPDTSLRSTEISQTPPTAVGVRHEKFRSFRSGRCPGGHFFKAGKALCAIVESSDTGAPSCVQSHKATEAASRCALTVLFGAHRIRTHAQTHKRHPDRPRPKSAGRDAPRLPRRPVTDRCPRRPVQPPLH